MPDLLSAPNEDYADHIKNCLQSWEFLASRFFSHLNRLFSEPSDVVNCAISWMLFSHDIGKLTQKWQEKIADGTKPPPHASLGAAFLLEQMSSMRSDSNLTHASVFAVLIHHVDSGIVGNNLESPDAQAILYGLTGGRGEAIIWHEEADVLLNKIFDAHKNLLGDGKNISLQKVTLQSLRKLSETLRNWSKCPKLLDQHRHRMLGSALHHLLKVCDWRAAEKRQTNGEDQQARQSVLQCLLRGGLLV